MKFLVDSDGHPDLEEYSYPDLQPEKIRKRKKKEKEAPVETEKATSKKSKKSKKSKAANYSDTDSSSSELAGPVAEPEDENPFPFRLTYLSSYANNCGLCRSMKCRGCPIPCDDTYLLKRDPSFGIAVNWDEEFLQQR